MLARVYQYRLSNVGWDLPLYTGQVCLGCTTIGYVMLDGLYKYRQGNVG